MDHPVKIIFTIELSYLQESTRPDISMVVHQCARFSKYPRLIHERAVQKNSKYFSETATRGIIYDPDKTQGIEFYVYTDFDLGWDRDDGQQADNVLSLDLDMPYLMLGSQYYGQINYKGKLL